MKPKYTIYPLTITGLVLTIIGCVIHDWYLLAAGAIFYVPNIIVHKP